VPTLVLDKKFGLDRGWTQFVEFRCFEAMAVLGGQNLNSSRLGLSNAFDASNKHVVFVKLTDSSLDALQNYIRNNTSKSSSSSSWNKPTIQFSKHSGVSRLLNFFIDPWDFDVKSSQSAKHERRRGLLNSSSNFYHLLLLKYLLGITTNSKSVKAAVC